MKKYLVALAIVLIDVVVFVAPLGAIFLAYVLIAKPKWFFEYVDKL